MSYEGKARNRCWKVVPGFLWVLLAACGGAEVEPDLLARVGGAEIRGADLEAFELRLLQAEQMNVYDKAAYEQSLETLVDREVLLLEARRRSLATDAQVMEWMANSRRR